MNGSVVPGAVPAMPAPEWMRNSVHLAHKPGAADFDRQPPPGGRARVIGVVEHSLTTRSLVLDVTDPSAEVARIAVLERHNGTGRIGLGYVQGFGLRHGAIASTVAHDAHNCMVVGAIGAGGPSEMAIAASRLAEIGGGQVAVLNGEVVAEVPLPIGGLMSGLPAVDVAAEVDRLAHLSTGALGLTIEAPFMQLSFLGLSVLPELRLTDLGLVDVTSFSLCDVEVPSSS
jgi:adenine deaminase